MAKIEILADSKRGTKNPADFLIPRTRRFLAFRLNLPSLPSTRKLIFMGWSHHWQRDTELPATEFSRAVGDCSRLLGKVDIPLAGPDGTGAPVFRPDVVTFNGAIPYKCEPFEIHQTEFDRRGRKVFWSFCKTEKLPYDLCVQLALIVFKHHLGDTLGVMSDGHDPDWQNAKSKCQEILGYGSEFSLNK